ncbi:hypothetical protein [Nocardia asteroides]|uniref:hypothetical protein n=1 Tax=Nocardia asteroides TaxID=1824 RepID=UPI0033C03F92
MNSEPGVVVGSGCGAVPATLAGYDLTLRVAGTRPLDQAVTAHPRRTEGGCAAGSR